MANDVVLGAAMRSNLLSLQNTQRSIDNTQLRLATGKKVNSALDNPQSFFQAQSLNNRASDLTRLLDGIGQSIRTIEEADKGITALTKLVEQASSVADEAMSEMNAAAGLATITGTKDLRGIDNLVADSGGAIVANAQFTITISGEGVDSDVGTDGDQDIAVTYTIATGQDIYDVVAAINADTSTDPGEDVRDHLRASVDSQGRLKLESTTEGAMVRLSDDGTATALGAAGFEYLGLSGYVATENAGDPATELRQGGTVISGRTLYSAAADDAASVDGAGEVFEASALLVDALFMTSGDQIAVNLVIDGEEVEVIPTSGPLTDTSTIQDLIDGINNAGSDKVTARFNTDTGEIEIQFDESVGTAELEIESVAASVVSFGFGTGGSDNAVASTANDINSESFRFIGSSANLDQYTKDFNKLRDQIDGIVEDANYRGVNLLGGDKLTSFFNEDRSNTLVTEGEDLTALGLGVSEADFADAAGIEKSLNEVRNALDDIRAFGSSIANDLSIIQTRRDFTEQTINTLKAGASDLTDADLNEEGANLLALQTAQQLGVTSLSLASQSQQSVLRLF
jgi:flagellin-like hook-associated protein FlgL